MEQTKKDNIPGILVSVDFRKAFDSLEWSCFQHSLEKFNFGEYKKMDLYFLQGN